MRVVIFSAYGKTGGLLVDRATSKVRGHWFAMLAKFTKNGIRAIAGDATELEDVIHACARARSRY